MMTGTCSSRVSFAGDQPSLKLGVSLGHAREALIDKRVSNPERLLKAWPISCVLIHALPSRETHNVDRTSAPDELLHCRFEQSHLGLHHPHKDQLLVEHRKHALQP